MLDRGSGEVTQAVGDSAQVTTSFGVLDAHREDGKLSLSIKRGGRETYRQKDDSRHDVRMLIVDGRTGEVATSLAYDL